MDSDGFPWTQHMRYLTIHGQPSGSPTPIPNLLVRSMKRLSKNLVKMGANGFNLLSE